MITDFVLITTLSQSVLTYKGGLNWCTFLCNHSGLEVHNGTRGDLPHAMNGPGLVAI